MSKQPFRLQTSARDNMPCPYCGSTGMKVIDSRWTKTRRAIRRRRQCTVLTCQRHSITIEVTYDDYNQLLCQINELRSRLRAFANLKERLLMPAKSEKERKFMGAELRRKRQGKQTETGMTEKQLEEFAEKPVKPGRRTKKKGARKGK